MADWAAPSADDANFSLNFDTFLDQNQYEFQELNYSDVQSTGIFHEMANMPPPELPNIDETHNVADNTLPDPAPMPSTSRHKILTSSDVDNIQMESVKARTRKQTDWGVKVFKGKEICTEKSRKTTYVNNFQFFLNMRTKNALSCKTPVFFI